MSSFELLFERFRERVVEACAPELTGAAAELDEAQSPKDKPSEKSQHRGARPRALGLPPSCRARRSRSRSLPRDRLPSCGASAPSSAMTRASSFESHAGPVSGPPDPPREARLRELPRHRGASAGAGARDRARQARIGLVAQILVAKYLEHTPLYRQREIYKRSRVNLPRSTWAMRSRRAATLAPVARRIRSGARARHREHGGYRAAGARSAGMPTDRSAVSLALCRRARFAYFAYTPTARERAAGGARRLPGLSPGRWLRRLRRAVSREGLPADRGGLLHARAALLRRGGRGG